MCNMATAKTTTFQIIAATMARCGLNGLSNEDIARGMMLSSVHETGANPNSGQLKAKARKIGHGRWAVTMEAERYGQRSTPKATAVMDKKGDIHYYAD